MNNLLNNCNLIKNGSEIIILVELQYQTMLASFLETQKKKKKEFDEEKI